MCFEVFQVVHLARKDPGGVFAPVTANNHMQPDQTPEKWVADSDETKKSMQTGQEVIELNKTLSKQDGKDPEAEEKKDQEKWRNEK